MPDYMDTVYADSNDRETDTILRCSECGLRVNHTNDPEKSEDDDCPLKKDGCEGYLQVCD